MRIVLDFENYFVAGSLAEYVECEYGTCQEYTGAIPTGFSSYEDWFVNCECKNAWKMVDNNLVYDENKYNELQKLYKIQEEENAVATHGWVKDKLKVSSNVVTDELSSAKYGTTLIVLNDAGNYVIPELKIESVSAESVNVISSNKNILGIDCVTSAINGIEIKNNGDGTITLNGTSEDSIEFDLN